MRLAVGGGEHPPRPAAHQSTGLSGTAVTAHGRRAPLDRRAHAVGAVVGVVLALWSAGHRLTADSHRRARVTPPEHLARGEEVNSSRQRGHRVTPDAHPGTDHAPGQSGSLPATGRRRTPGNPRARGQPAAPQHSPDEPAHSGRPRAQYPLGVACAPRRLLCLPAMALLSPALERRPGLVGTADTASVPTVACLR